MCSHHLVDAKQVLEGSVGLQLIRQTQGQLPSRVASRNGAGQDRSISLLICFLIKAREEGREKARERWKLWWFLPLYLKALIKSLISPSCIIKPCDADVTWLAVLLRQLGPWSSSPVPPWARPKKFASRGRFFQQPFMDSCDGLTAFLRVSFCSANCTLFSLGCSQCFASWTRSVRIHSQW